jgi:hypothetical protein
MDNLLDGGDFQTMMGERLMKGVHGEINPKGLTKKCVHRLHGRVSKRSIRFFKENLAPAARGD